MKRKLLGAISFFILAADSLPSFAQSTLSRVNVSSEGEESSGVSAGYGSDVSDYGHVVFCSSASNLVPNDNNGHLGWGGSSDVFVHNIHTGITERMSISSEGVEANENNFEPAISADGRFVTFASVATNLVEETIESGVEFLPTMVYLRDRLLNETSLISKGYDGSLVNGDSRDTDISDDGNFIVFTSSATNLTEGEFPTGRAVYLYNRTDGTTTLVSKNNAGDIANGWVFTPKISGNGQRIAYVSTATNIDSRDRETNRDLYIYDTETGTTELVCVNRNNERCNVSNDSVDQGQFDLSFDGNLVTFSTSASDLVENDTNDQTDVFVRDISHGVTTRVSLSFSGGESNGRSVYPSISGDGRFVTFQSYAFNLIENDTNNTRDIFIYDRLEDSTRRISPMEGAPEANSWSGYSGVNISTNGRYVNFESNASNLVENDLNGYVDMFLVDIVGNAEPTINILSPAENSIFSTGDLVSFSAQAIDHEDGDISAAIVWASDIDGVLSSPSHLSEGTHTLTASVADSKGLEAQASVQVQVAAPVQLENIVDIGYTAEASSFTQVDGSDRFVLSAAGVSIGGWTDNFSFVYQEVEGDVDFIAQITNIENGWSVGGIMMRESLDTSSKFAAGLLEKHVGGFFMFRDAEYTHSNSQSVSALTEGSWIRLRREADVITAFISLDGESWSEIASVNLGTWENLYVGLAGATVENRATTNMTFDNVSIN